MQVRISSGPSSHSLAAPQKMHFTPFTRHELEHRPDGHVTAELTSSGPRRNFQAMRGTVLQLGIQKHKAGLPASPSFLLSLPPSLFFPFSSLLRPSWPIILYCRLHTSADLAAAHVLSHGGSDAAPCRGCLCKATSYQKSLREVCLQVEDGGDRSLKNKNCRCA